MLFSERAQVALYGERRQRKQPLRRRETARAAFVVGPLARAAFALDSRAMVVELRDAKRLVPCSR
jgi:hypothetical protein